MNSSHIDPYTKRLAGGVFVTVTVAVSDLVLSAFDVAVTSTVAGLGTAAGAV